MSRTNCTLIGMVLIMIAGIVIWGRWIALVPLTAGVGFIFWPFYMDFKYGEQRPSKREIRDMPLEEYRRNIKNPKFRKWVDDLKITVPHDKGNG
jgi:hypothetical protein